MAYGNILGQTPIASNVLYNNSQTSSVITGNTVQQAIDQLFTSVSNGKNLIASAITDKGVSTSGNDSFQTMANNILNINTPTIITNINPVYTNLYYCNQFLGDFSKGLPDYFYFGTAGIGNITLHTNSTSYSGMICGGQITIFSKTGTGISYIYGSNINGQNYAFQGNFYMAINEEGNMINYTNAPYISYQSNTNQQFIAIAIYNN